MGFEIGKKYPDAVGRRWKVLACRSVNGQCTMLVRHLLRTEIAIRDTQDRATILLDYGFTTLYAEEEE